MKIFLNDRKIKFIPLIPENPPASDMVVEFRSPEQLKSAWVEFQRYDKFRNLLIIDPGFNDHTPSAAFESFISMFKYIPAAGGLVKNERGDFLFIHRFGNWDLPKGKIDKSDVPGPENSINDPVTAGVAAIREVKEETGLKTVTLQRELPSTWHIYPLREKWVLKKTSWFEMSADSTQKLKPATDEGIFLVKWTPPAGIHCILSHTYASLREFLLEVIF